MKGKHFPVIVQLSPTDEQTHSVLSTHTRNYTFLNKIFFLLSPTGSK